MNTAGRRSQPLAGLRPETASAIRRMSAEIATRCDRELRHTHNRSPYRDIVRRSAEAVMAEYFASEEQHGGPGDTG